MSSLPCRLCLEENKENIDLFNKDSSGSHLRDVISTFLFITINKTDTLTFICTQCIDLLENFNDYYKRVNAAQHALSKSYIKHKSMYFSLSPDKSIPLDVKKEIIEERKTINSDDSLNTIELDTDNLFTSIDDDQDILIVSNNDKLDNNSDELIEAYELDYIDNDVDDYDMGSDHKSSTKCSLNQKINRKSTHASRRKKKIDHSAEEEYLDFDENINLEDISNCSVEIVKNGKLLLKGGLLENLVNKFYKLECELCDGLPKFERISELFSHYKSEHKILGYITCCDMQMSNRAKINLHLAWHLQPSAFECPVCKKTIMRLQALEFHIKTHFPNVKKAFKCDQCNLSYRYSSGLRTHKMSHVPVEERKSFECQFCKKQFTLEASFSNHVRTVHASVKHLCAKCGKGCKTKHALILHMRSHDPKNKHCVRCQHCGFVCRNDRSLQSHIKLHSTERFHCNLCSFSSHLRYKLASHMKVRHTDIKPHVCSFCDKAFKLKKVLDTHLAQHTGERKYACVVCYKTFASSANYYNHRKKLHPEIYPTKNTTSNQQTPKLKSLTTQPIT